MQNRTILILTVVGYLQKSNINDIAFFLKKLKQKTECKVIRNKILTTNLNFN